MTTVFNEATAIPFTRLFTKPIHPGIKLGTEFNYRNKQNFNSRLFQTVNTCYYYHNYLEQGIGFNTELGYEYHFKFGFSASGLLGIGYLHTFFTQTATFWFVEFSYLHLGKPGPIKLTKNAL